MDTLESIPFIVFVIFAIILIILWILFSSFSISEKYAQQQEARRKIKVARLEKMLEYYSNDESQEEGESANSD